MTFQAPPVKTFDLLPDNAPFTPEQRVWLSGFFAGYLNLDTAAVTALSPGEALEMVGAPAAQEDEDAPWHDPAMAIGDRLKLAEGRSVNVCRCCESCNNCVSDLVDNH